MRGSSDAAACVASPASAHDSALASYRPCILDSALDSALEPPPRDGTATAPRPNLGELKLTRGVVEYLDDDLLVRDDLNHKGSRHLLVHERRDDEEGEALLAAILLHLKLGVKSFVKRDLRRHTVGEAHVHVGLAHHLLVPIRQNLDLLIIELCERRASSVAHWVSSRQAGTRHVQAKCRPGTCRRKACQGPTAAGSSAGGVRQYALRMMCKPISAPSIGVESTMESVAESSAAPVSGSLSHTRYCGFLFHVFSGANLAPVSLSPFFLERGPWLAVDHTPLNLYELPSKSGTSSRVSSALAMKDIVKMPSSPGVNVEATTKSGPISGSYSKLSQAWSSPYSPQLAMST